MVNWLLSNCLLALALAFLVFGITRLLRPSPATVHALWCVVLLKLLSPLGLWWELPVRLPHSEPEVVQRPLPQVEPPLILPSEIAQTPLPSEPLWVVEPNEPQAIREPAPAVATPAVGVEIPPISRESTPLEFLGLILAIGAVVYLLRQILSTWRFCRVARFAGHAPEALLREVQRVSDELGIRTPRVGVLRGLPSPVMWTLRKPLLLWPEGLEGTLNRDERETVLIHELAHLRRRDHWVRWLEVICGLLHWWNPLFWYARRQLRLQAELACDAWVMATKPEHRRIYAEALLQVCSRSMRVSRAAPVLGIGGDGKRDFQRRLTMIMQNDAPCRLSRWGRAGVLMLVIAFLPGFTLAQEEKKKTETKTIEVEVVPATTGEFEFVIQSAPIAKQEPMDPEKAKKVKELEEKLAELHKQLAELKGQKAIEKKIEYRYEIITAPKGDVVVPKTGATGGGGGSALPHVPHVKVFDKDGKELKDIKVTIVREANSQPKFNVIGADGKPRGDVMIFVHQGTSGTPIVMPLGGGQGTPPLGIPIWSQGGPAPKDKVIEVRGALDKIETARIVVGEKVNPNNLINLTRASYALPKESAEQLMGMFKDKAKGSILEMKYEADKLVVTTTPEIQAVIGNVINLMTGKPVTQSINVRSGQNLFGTGGGSYPAAPALIAPLPAVPPFPPTIPAPPVAPPVAPPKKQPEQLNAPRELAVDR
jgi:beta-lactamase regulating signal transducer with metallopeptidase domain